MGARTGRQYIKGLQDQQREVWLGGERVKDVTTHPAFRNSAASVALLYEALHDKAQKDVLVDEISVTDNALTRPWKVTKTYNRDSDPRPFWREDVCAEGNSHVYIGGDNYMISADGHLMPAKKGQKPPDMRHFRANQ